MRYVSFAAQGRQSYGIAVKGGVHDLGLRHGDTIPDLRSYLAISAQGFSPPAQQAHRDLADGEFTYLPVVPAPAKILCVGLNYEEHRRETGRPEAAHPAIFTRFADSLTGHEEPILLPKISSVLDYEGELAVVIGRPAFRVREADAMHHVAGYACFNDGTLRDWQRHTHQFIPGKNFPSTGGFGPHLVTPDEAGDLSDQPIVTTVNGEVVQSAKLGEMIFSMARIISYVSSFTRLAPGDVIATGTPGGVGFKREPQLLLKQGDRVEVSIGSIGTLSNTVEAED